MATLIGFGNLAERDPPAGSFDFPPPPSHAPGASFSLAPWLQGDSFRGCPHYKCDEVDHDVHNHSCIVFLGNREVSQPEESQADLNPSP